MTKLTVVHRRTTSHSSLLWWVLGSAFIFSSVMVQAQERGKTPDVILQQQARMKVADEREQQNTVELNQQGKNNAVRVQQLAPEGAPGNHLSATQAGSQQVVVGLQRGTANTAVTRQAGKENAVLLLQDGTFNQVIATQRGAENQARILSQQSAQPPVIVQQRGTGNQADVILRNKSKPTDKPIQIKQSGKAPPVKIVH